MDLFIFASKTERNIEIGYERKLWAIAPPEDENFFNVLCTKSLNIVPGAVGVIYCSEYPRNTWFSIPFEITSEIDLERAEIRDVWPEPWFFPFTIEPLGHWSNSIPSVAAKDSWRFLGSNLRSVVSPTTVFNKISIDVGEWEQVLRDIGG